MSPAGLIDRRVVSQGSVTHGDAPPEKREPRLRETDDPIDVPEGMRPAGPIIALAAPEIAGPAMLPAFRAVLITKLLALLMTLDVVLKNPPP